MAKEKANLSQMCAIKGVSKGVSSRHDIKSPEGSGKFAPFFSCDLHGLRALLLQDTNGAAKEFVIGSQRKIDKLHLLASD